jgi:hypothetical protein
MAFKLSGTTLIDNSRNLSNIPAIDVQTAQAAFNSIVQKNTLEAGSTVRASRDTEVSKTSAGYVAHSNWAFVQRGEVRFSFEIRNSATAGANIDCRITRTRNDSNTVVVTQTTTNTTYEAYTSDQTILPGDRFWFEVQGGFSRTGFLRNVRIQTSANTYYIPASGSQFFTFTLDQL